MTWFEQLTGIAEETPESVRQHLTVDGMKCPKVPKAQLQSVFDGVQGSTHFGFDLGSNSGAGSRQKRKVGEVSGQPNSTGNDQVRVGAVATQPLSRFVGKVF